MYLNVYHSKILSSSNNFDIDILMLKIFYSLSQLKSHEINIIEIIIHFKHRIPNLIGLTIAFIPFQVLGDPRTNQNPAMVTFGILLMRWHNVVAARIHKQHPDWTDEQLFQRARRIVIASLQVFDFKFQASLIFFYSARITTLCFVCSLCFIKVENTFKLE